MQDAASFWSQQPLTAREYALSTIIPACAAVAEASNNAKDLIEKEVSTFYRSPDNSLYMLPSSPQVYNAPTDNLFTCLFSITYVRIEKREILPIHSFEHSLLLDEIYWKSQNTDRFFSLILNQYLSANF